MPRSRYPRRGHRIAPAALRALLGVPVPASFGAARRDVTGLLLADLDETAWERFAEEECQQLAAEVVRVLGRAARMPIKIGDQRLPPLPEGLTLADLHLEVRTVNCLVSAGIHERPQDLHNMTIQGVLGLRGFWVKSLVDLLTSLEYAIDHPDVRKSLRTDSPVAIKQLRAAHRYPRPSHRLAPETLREVFLDRLPTRLVRGTPLSKSRLCDLDETAWDHLEPEVISHLAGLIVARAGSVVHNRTIMQRRLPRPPKGLRLDDLHLENRTHNCLAREGFARRTEALGRLTVADLLSFRAFGAKCLIDLLTSLETRVAREGKLDPRLTEEAAAMAALPGASRITFGDPRLGNRLRVLDTESGTVGQMTRRILRRRLDPPDPASVQQQLQAIRENISKLERLSLEDELSEIFAPSSSLRDRRIVAAYYGWDARGGCTLDELGRRHGLSRERIRQICVRAVARNANTQVFAPVLDRALRFVAERIPCSLARLQAEFDQAGFSACGLPIDSIRRAAEFLSRSATFEVVDTGPARLVVAPEQAALPRLIARAAKRAVANLGAARIADITAELSHLDIPKIDPTLVREALEIRCDFSWLDAGRNWFRLSALPQYGLPNVIEKVLSVVERIDVARLRQAIARYRRSTRKLPPSRILREFCAQMPQVRLEGTTVISDPPRDWRKVLAGVERGMVRVLKRHGPVLDRTAFEEHCIRDGMNRFSFNAIVMCSPVIEQYGRSVYGLIGRKVSRQTVNALLNRRAETPPSRVLKAFGRTRDGRSYLGYRLSKAAISGGVITVPAAMKRELLGKFTLRTEEKHSVGTLVAKKGCGRGLGPALRGRQAKQGDHLLLLFDAEKREARLQLGDETIIVTVHRGLSPLAAALRVKGTGPCFRPAVYLPNTSFGRKMDQSPTNP